MGQFAIRGTVFKVALAILSALAATVIFSAPAQALERPFDADLSLTGGCSTDKLDPVPDPGCPGGPHPPASFAAPAAVTTDFYGNIYVAVFGSALNGSQGRIDIFDPQGRFRTEIKTQGPRGVAVDSTGVLYVSAFFPPDEHIEILRYTPTTYEPTQYTVGTDHIAYGSTPETPISLKGSRSMALGLNRLNDHLFVTRGADIIEYTSAAEGNTEVREVLLPEPYFAGFGIAVDAQRGRLYVSEGKDSRIGIYDLDPPSAMIGTIEEDEVPSGDFLQWFSVAVEEATGNVFVFDGAASKLYEFDEDGTYLETVDYPFEAALEGPQIGVDNGPFSPNGGENTKAAGHYLFVPSHRIGIGHLFAFEPEPEIKKPEVNGLEVLGVSETEAEFAVSINPKGAETQYAIEYTPLQKFEEEGFENATLAQAGQLPGVNQNFARSASVAGLEPGETYRVRARATNSEGEDEEEMTFRTYLSPSIDTVSCPNSGLRTGISALLPDCRAYELVTPADTNARAPVGAVRIGAYFLTRQVSPGGDRVPWRVEGGALAEKEATGGLLGDPYLSSRGPNGWSTESIGPSGFEATSVTPGGTSPDQGYSFWTSGGSGSKAEESKMTSYVRYPDGHSEILGLGSIGTDNQATGRLISEDGEHIIFNTGEVPPAPAIQLEPDAAPTGTPAIYDRTPDGVTHVISLLPEDEPLVAGQKADYYGASHDGKGVAFAVGNTLYLRFNNEETYEVGVGVDFAGIAEGGSEIFYVEGGDLFRFDAQTEEVTPFNSSGSVTPVSVSADGRAAYVVSTSDFGTEPNPNGATPVAGQQNLYLSLEGSMTFVATVTERDVNGTAGPVEDVDGLGLWVTANEPPTPGRLGLVPARTTPDGSVLLFESRAELDGYDPEGSAQIYRYDSIGQELQCLSCNPTGAKATGFASLQSESREETFALFDPLVWIENLRSDGRRAVFQSTEALVVGDNDNLQDVYQWEDEGVGSCRQEKGCVQLISSGHSARNDYLWAVSESGNDIFFLSSDLLVPADKDETASIYDARVGGGFPEPSAGTICEGEGCRPGLTPPPLLPLPPTASGGPNDNVVPRKCPKGKRQVKKNGKVRCVKKHKKHRRKSPAQRKGVQK